MKCKQSPTHTHIRHFNSNWLHAAPDGTVCDSHNVSCIIISCHIRRKHNERKHRNQWHFIWIINEPIFYNVLSSQAVVRELGAVARILINAWAWASNKSWRDKTSKLRREIISCTITASETYTYIRIYACLVSCLYQSRARTFHNLWNFSGIKIANHK